MVSAFNLGCYCCRINLIVEAIRKGYECIIVCLSCVLAENSILGSLTFLSLGCDAYLSLSLIGLINTLNDKLAVVLYGSDNLFKKISANIKKNFRIAFSFYFPI